MAMTVPFALRGNQPAAAAQQIFRARTVAGGDAGHVGADMARADERHGEVVVHAGCPSHLIIA